MIVLIVIGQAARHGKGEYAGHVRGRTRPSTSAPTTQRRLLPDLPGLREPGPSSPCEARAVMFPRGRVSPANDNDGKHTMGSVADKIAK